MKSKKEGDISIKIIGRKIEKIVGMIVAGVALQMRIAVVVVVVITVPRFKIILLGLLQLLSIGMQTVVLLPTLV